MRKKLSILAVLTLISGGLLFLFPGAMGINADAGDVGKPFIQVGIFLFAVFAIMFVPAPD